MDASQGRAGDTPRFTGRTSGFAGRTFPKARMHYVIDVCDVASAILSFESPSLDKPSETVCVQLR